MRPASRRDLEARTSLITQRTRPAALEQDSQQVTRMVLSVYVTNPTPCQSGLAHYKTYLKLNVLLARRGGGAKGWVLSAQFHAAFRKIRSNEEEDGAGTVP